MTTILKFAARQPLALRDWHAPRDDRIGPDADDQHEGFTKIDRTGKACWKPAVRWGELGAAFALIGRKRRWGRWRDYS